MSKRERSVKQASGPYITQKDVALRAGVSSSIVSYVINNGPRSISEETRQRVLRAIEELDYRPNVHAQKLKLASWENELAPRNFGVVFGGSRDVLLRPFYLSITYSILDEAVHKALNMRFMLFYEDLSNAQLFNKLIHPEEISAVLLLKPGPKLWSEDGVSLLARIRARIPNIVSVGRQTPGIPSVTFDVSQAIYQAAHHILELGHRQIAYIGTTETRIAGFKRALADFEIPYNPTLVIPHEVYNTVESGYTAAQTLLASGALQGPARVTAIVIASDEVAWGVMRCLKEAGLRIPEDVSLICIDDDAYNTYLVPALTTVKIPKDQIGRLALQLMLNRKGHLHEPPETTLLPTELIIRESCAPRS